MIDVTTKEPLQVSTDGTAGPYISVPLIQLEQIQRLLDSHGIRYYVQENAISLDGGPMIADIDLGRGADADHVQSLLDSVR